MGRYKFNRHDAGLDRIIPEEEARRTIIQCENSQKHLGVLVAFLWLFGCRLNEVLRLRRIDIRIEGAYLIVEMPRSKQRSERENEIPHILKVLVLAPFVQEFILPYIETREPSDSLFTWSPQWVRKWVRKANPMVSPHWFRKSRLSQLAIAEATDSQLTAWAGWKTSAPAKHYIEYGGRLAAQLSDRIK